MRQRQEKRYGPYTMVPYTEFYLVTWDARAREWVLQHDAEGSGSGEGFVTYRLDLSWGSCERVNPLGDRELCPAMAHGQKQLCKHLRSLRAALTHIGVDPVAGPVAKVGAA
jgi:hypothetical protein